MKAKTIAASLALTFGLIAVTANGAYAHPNHDGVGMKLFWAFPKSTQTKIERILESKNLDIVVGLSKFEQGILDHYDIKSGNTFKISAGGMNWTVKRNSSGVQLVEVHHFLDTSDHHRAPIHPAGTFAPVSFKAASHAGHDHSVLPYEWVFSRSVRSKIDRLVQSSAFGGVVGLSSFEAGVIDRYGIKVGNTFVADVAGKDWKMERTTLGLKISPKMGGVL